MFVKKSETGNFIFDMCQMLKKGKKPKIFITLFESKDNLLVLSKVLEHIKINATGVIIDDKLLNCRAASMFEKIRTINSSCGFEMFTLEDVKKQTMDDEEIIIIVQNKYSFLYKIKDVLENAEVSCCLYHLSDLQYEITNPDPLNGHLPSESGCSGCGACKNVCPVNAITMEFSDKGFLVPVIDKEKCINCNLCTNTCPALNPMFKNNKEPKFYSFCASDEIRKDSSSGGMFTVLSEYVLSKGGYVCGAAFDNKMQLKHIIINKKEELSAIKGSKYLQSNLGECYKSIKVLLDNEQYVLFTGTPCQIAGMKAFLKKEYDNLLTAEILCHGVPSQKFFDKYLEDISQGRKVVDVEFRSKRLGWPHSGMIVHYEDGSEEIRKWKATPKNPYYSAFMDNMMLRDMCYDCVFNNYPRQGDFTMGDLWHSDKLDPKSNDKKGTSFVFLNNKKAEEIFNEISASAKYYKQLPVSDYSKIPNRIGPKRKVNPLRDRFLELLKEKSFTEAYDCTVNEVFDIGMPCVLYNDNIGSVLTYFALYKTLTDMNYSVLPIERPLDSPLAVSEKAKKFNQKWLPSYAQPVRYENVFEMYKLNKKCKQYVLGSDQIFLEAMSARRNHFFMLQWAEENKYRISYSSSFGGPGARGTEEYYDQLKYHLNKFGHISCRENNGVEFANNELKLKQHVDWCIDPVFLCDKSHYDALVDSVAVVRTAEFIGGYVIVPRASINKLITKTKEHFDDMPAEILGDDEKASKVKEFTYSCIHPFPIENALELIRNCKYFVTDSFHGVCFAVIFKKDFLAIPRDFPDRFTSLLNRIGLEDRIIKNDLSNFSEKSFEPVDWDSVYEKLQVLIDDSRQWLVDALEFEQKDNSFTDYDILMNYIRKQNQEIKELKEIVKNLK